MENLEFQDESYSLGFISGLFVATKSMTEFHAKKYLELSKKLGQSLDEEIEKYILSIHPQIIKL